MSSVLPDTPFMSSVIKERGSEYLFKTYFNDDMEVREDAPDELKREIELLRSND